MTCTHVQNRLTRYLERMCEKSDVATIARHIESCPACAKQLAMMQQVKSYVHLVRNVEANPFVITEMMTAIRERTTYALPGRRSPARRPSLFRRAGYMMAAAVVVVTAVTLTWYMLTPAPPLVVQNPREGDDMTIYLQEHALHADQSVFSTGAFGSVMVNRNRTK